MTKQELEQRVEELEQKVVDLERALDYADDDYALQEDEIQKLRDELEWSAQNGIINVENFIFRLKLDNMWSEELEKEIYEYVQYHNE